MHLRRGARRLWIAPIIIALFASACSGSASTTLVEPAASEATSAPAEPEPEPQPEPTAEPLPEPTAEPTPEPTATPEPTPEPTPTPEPVFFASELEPGDCFNRVPGNPPLTPPDKVSCDELHDEEVYAKAFLSDGPQAPYPGEDALADRAAAELCDAATIDFAGEPWDRLGMFTALLYPLEEEWAAGDRTIMCSASSFEDGTRKLGTAAGGTLDSDDVLIVRSSLTSDGVSFNDWTAFSEATTIDTLGSLTDGQLDIPLRRPFLGPQGFLFSTPDPDGDGHETKTWSYRWETQELRDLGSILPGYEISTALVLEDGAVIFSARETPGGDFDLWRADNGTADILIGGEGSQQYPSLTPDQTQIVYQDFGDIWVADVDGSNKLQLTSSRANDFESTVSPDGTTVVFASDRGGNDDLWAVPITGGEPVNLTNHPADENWPVFSEDGSKIYFGSDRLVPEEDRSMIMMMNADGSNPSWFAAASGSQHIVVPQEFAELMRTSVPTLNERFNFDLVDGEPGTTTAWAHSDGRLSAEFPAGWRVGEFTDGFGFIAGPRPDTYFTSWEIDGVEVRLYDGETEASFFAIVEESPAIQSCEKFDGTDGIVPIAENVVGTSANHNCGSDGAVAGVVGLYNQATGVGVVIQGQRDNLPDADTDEAMINAIAQSLTWE